MCRYNLAFAQRNFDYFTRKCKTRTLIKSCWWCKFDTNYICPSVLLLLFICKTSHFGITLESCIFTSTAVKHKHNFPRTAFFLDFQTFALQIQKQNVKVEMLVRSFFFLDCPKMYFQDFRKHIFLDIFFKF